jgi:hypothetical protein
VHVRSALLCSVVACAPPPTGPTTLSVSVSATTATPAEGETIAVEAHVKNASGGVRYAWEQATPEDVALRGTFATAAERTAFKLPGLCKDEHFELRVTISDDAGATASQSVAFDATNLERPLELAGIFASKTTVSAGVAITLDAQAYGPGCGPKYAWSQLTAATTGGFEGSTSVGLVTWRAPLVPGTYRLALVVSDEGGTALPAQPIDIVVVK